MLSSPNEGMRQNLFYESAAQLNWRKQLETDDEEKQRRKLSLFPPRLCQFLELFKSLEIETSQGEK